MNRYSESIYEKHAYILFKNSLLSIFFIIKKYCLIRVKNILVKEYTNPELNYKWETCISLFTFVFLNGNMTYLFSENKFLLN